MAEFIKKRPQPTMCARYGSGGCCWDRHFRANAVAPTALEGEALCDRANGTLTPGRLTSIKADVNCKECLELIHS